MHASQKDFWIHVGGKLFYASALSIIFFTVKLLRSILLLQAGRPHCKKNTMEAAADAKDLVIHD